MAPTARTLRRKRGGSSPPRALKTSAIRSQMMMPAAMKSVRYVNHLRILDARFSGSFFMALPSTQETYRNTGNEMIMDAVSMRIVWNDESMYPYRSGSGYARLMNW